MEYLIKVCNKKLRDARDKHHSKTVTTNTKFEGHQEIEINRRIA